MAFEYLMICDIPYYPVVEGNLGPVAWVSFPVGQVSPAVLSNVSQFSDYRT